MTWRHLPNLLIDKNDEKTINALKNDMYPLIKKYKDTDKSRKEDYEKTMKEQDSNRKKQVK